MKFFAMEEEFDYLSDEVLKQCVEQEKNQSLQFNKNKKRPYALSKQKIEAEKKPLKQLESERREEGLNTAIAEDNKGFMLLQKLGYKSGSGLGKSKIGRETPIKVNVKDDKFGLGLLSSVIEKQKERAAQFSSEKFRSEVSKKLTSKETKFDYNKSRRICHHFDTTEAKLEKPIEKWYWPDFAVESTDDDDDDDEREEEDEEIEEFEISDRTECILKYVRTKYNYCVWCATVFEDEKDMAQSCPGVSRKAHDD